MGLRTRNSSNIAIFHRAPKLVKLFQFNTMQEGEKLLRRIPGMKFVDLTGLELSQVQLLAEILLYEDELLPKLPLGLSEIIPVSLVAQRHPFAETYDGLMGILAREDGYNSLYFNPGKLQSGLAQIKKDRTVNFGRGDVPMPAILRDEPFSVAQSFDSLDDVFRGVILHEFGHLRMLSLLQKKQIQPLAPLLSPKNFVSKYVKWAAENGNKTLLLHESFAESFVLYRLRPEGLNSSVRSTMDSLLDQSENR